MMDHKAETNVIGKDSYEQDLPQTEAELFDLAQYTLLDIDDARRILGSERQVRHLLDMMVSKNIVMDDVEKLKAAHQLNDWNRVQALAHKIKSGAIYIGTKRMKMACQYLERYWKVGERKALERLYQQVLTVIDETHEAARQWLRETSKKERQ